MRFERRFAAESIEKQILLETGALRHFPKWHANTAKTTEKKFGKITGVPAVTRGVVFENGTRETTKRGGFARIERRRTEKRMSTLSCRSIIRSRFVQCIVINGFARCGRRSTGNQLKHHDGVPTRARRSSGSDSPISVRSIRTRNYNVTKRERERRVPSHGRARRSREWLTTGNSGGVGLEKACTRCKECLYGIRIMSRWRSRVFYWLREIYFHSDFSFTRAFYVEFFHRKQSVQVVWFAFSTNDKIPYTNSSYDCYRGLYQICLFSGWLLGRLINLESTLKSLVWATRFCLRFLMRKCYS